MLLPTLMCSGILFSQVRFDTSFESGSLEKAKLVDSVKFRISPNDSTTLLSYDIFSRFDPRNPIDTTLASSARWYYFRMTGTRGNTLYLNIRNSEAIRPFYSYDGINFQRFSQDENPRRGLITKRFNRDTVYVSHYIPYTFSRHISKLDEWKSLPYVKGEEIGRSSQGLPIDMITVTDPSVPESQKRKVWIHGRSHPSEQPASWHLEAMIDLIVSDNPDAVQMRKNAVFYIVPFINPDGVKGGYSRSTSTGVNIEINWDRPDSLTMPEVKALKAKMEQLTSDRPFDLLLNMHSQIANSVTYWIHTAKTTNESFLRKQLLLSSLTMGERRLYKPENQSFSDVGSRYAEGWIWNRFKDSTLAITFETPYTFYANNPAGEWVSPENLADLAKDSFYAVYDYLKIDGEHRIIIEPKNLLKRGWSTIEDNKLVYFGENAAESSNPGAKASFEKAFLKKGEYALYAWKAGPASETFPEDVNRWVRIGTAIQKRDGKFVWKARASHFNGIIDAIMLIKEQEN